MKLERRYIERPWGRTDLRPEFDAPSGTRIGEVRFTGGDDPPLLTKFLFTSEKLSIQVHPDDAQAQARGLSCGKSECWYILDAEPGATLGLGLRQETSRDELHAAALDGSIEELIDWLPIRAGDFFMIPPGTIHAVGGGISLLEFQQNSDVTYRLYDYGRPRELHLDEALAVARVEPFSRSLAQHVAPRDFRTLVDGPQFVLALSDRDTFCDRQRWIIPLEGTVRHGGVSAGFGDCLLVGPGERFETQARMLIGATA